MCMTVLSGSRTDAPGCMRQHETAIGVLIEQRATAGYHIQRWRRSAHHAVEDAVAALLAVDVLAVQARHAEGAVHARHWRLVEGVQPAARELGQTSGQLGVHLQDEPIRGAVHGACRSQCCCSAEGECETDTSYAAIEPCCKSHSGARRRNDPCACVGSASGPAYEARPREQCEVHASARQRAGKRHSRHVTGVRGRSGSHAP